MAYLVLKKDIHGLYTTATFHSPLGFFLPNGSTSAIFVGDGVDSIVAVLATILQCLATKAIVRSYPATVVVGVPFEALDQ